MTAPQVRQVHPHCDRSCSHGLPRPGPRPGTFAEPGPVPRQPREAPPVVVERCAACGYDRGTHDSAGKCPQVMADKNGRRGSFRPAPEPDTALWPEIIRRDVAARFAKIEAERAAYVPPVVLPPQVPARAPEGPGELAGYQGRQAVGLGRAATVREWRVEACYWRAGDGTEACAVRLARGDLRAVATWTRKHGSIGKLSGWAGGTAYGWRLGTLPVAINHTMLLEMITSGL